MNDFSNTLSQQSKKLRLPMDLFHQKTKPYTPRYHFFCLSYLFVFCMTNHFCTHQSMSIRLTVDFRSGLLKNHRKHTALFRFFLPRLLAGDNILQVLPSHTRRRLSENTFRLNVLSCSSHFLVNTSHYRPDSQIVKALSPMFFFLYNF